MRQDNEAPRDNQQIADDNQQSGYVSDQDLANQAAKQESAEGSREDTGGISNPPLEEEQDNKARVPPRGERKEEPHA
jgi:hypothetical protein